MSKANKKKFQRPTQKMIELLKATGSSSKNEAMNAMRALAQALEIPLRQGVLVGDIATDIFTPEPLDPGATAEYPLDFFQPENKDDYVAYTIPNEGTIPLRHIGGDVVTVQTFDVANSIDWLLKYSREARWNIVARAMEVLEAGFKQKINTDGWWTIIAAGVGRNTAVFDSVAPAGQFTKRLISIMKTQMRRLAGGNAASTNRGMLTDLYISPEALEDIREWNQDDVDEFTRRDIMVAQDGEGFLSRIYGVNLRPLDELGENQSLQDYFTNTLGASMAVGDKEIVVGLDLQKRDSFVMPIKQEITVFEDANLHRRRRAGVYAWGEWGFGVLDPRRVLIASF